MYIDIKFLFFTLLLSNSHPNVHHCHSGVGTSIFRVYIHVDPPSLVLLQRHVGNVDLEAASPSDAAEHFFGGLFDEMNNKLSAYGIQLQADYTALSVDTTVLAYRSDPCAAESPASVRGEAAQRYFEAVAGNVNPYDRSGILQKSHLSVLGNNLINTDPNISNTMISIGTHIVVAYCADRDLESDTHTFLSGACGSITVLTYTAPNMIAKDIRSQLLTAISRHRYEYYAYATPDFNAALCLASEKCIGYVAGPGGIHVDENVPIRHIVERKEEQGSQKLLEIEKGILDGEYSTVYGEECDSVSDFHESDIEHGLQTKMRGNTWAHRSRNTRRSLGPSDLKDVRSHHRQQFGTDDNDMHGRILNFHNGNETRNMNGHGNMNGHYDRSGTYIYDKSGRGNFINGGGTTNSGFGSYSTASGSSTPFNPNSAGASYSNSQRISPDEVNSNIRSIISQNNDIDSLVRDLKENIANNNTGEAQRLMSEIRSKSMEVDKNITNLQDNVSNSGTPGRLSADFSEIADKCNSASEVNEDVKKRIGEQKILHDINKRLEDVAIKNREISKGVGELNGISPNDDEMKRALNEVYEKNKDVERMIESMKSGNDLTSNIGSAVNKSNAVSNKLNELVGKSGGGNKSNAYLDGIARNNESVKKMIDNIGRDMLNSKDPAVMNDVVKDVIANDSGLKKMFDDLTDKMAVKPESADNIADIVKRNLDTERLKTEVKNDRPGVTDESIDDIVKRNVDIQKIIDDIKNRNKEDGGYNKDEINDILQANVDNAVKGIDKGNNNLGGSNENKLDDIIKKNLDVDGLREDIKNNKQPSGENKKLNDLIEKLQKEADQKKGSANNSLDSDKLDDIVKKNLDIPGLKDQLKNEVNNGKNDPAGNKSSAEKDKDLDKMVGDIKDKVGADDKKESEASDALKQFLKSTAGKMNDFHDTLK